MFADLIHFHHLTTLYSATESSTDGNVFDTFDRDNTIKGVRCFFLCVKCK